MIESAVYRDGQHFDCGDPAAELHALREADTGYLWIGLKDPTQEEFDQFNHSLHLHPLAVEDATKGNQRPKIDVYENSIFVVLKTLRYIESTSDVETGELMLFAGQNFVLTVRYGEANPLGDVRRRVAAQPMLIQLGPMAVVHAVIDHVVDSYRAIDVELGNDLGEIEEAVFDGDRDVEGPDIYRLKREVLEFKRGAMPLVEPLKRLLTERTVLVPKKLRPFFSDVLDHLLQVTEHAESYDRLLADIFAAYLAQQGLRQNEDMRRISAWVAIAAVPTMIAGIYGMNFKNMPELETQYGYFAVIGLMATVCLTLYVTFRHHKWL
ncbi:MAG: magnesium/cobalt transporter CorA [Dermatophilaceae bacterium]